MSFYLVDVIDIITPAYDANGVQTTTTALNVPARVSERNRLVLGRDGKEVLGAIQVMLATGTTIGYDSKIRVKSVAGAVYAYSSKEWQVKSVSQAHTIGAKFVEVWV